LHFSTRTSVLFAIVSAIVGVTLHPARAQVLHDHDNSPFTGIFGLPDAGEGGDLLTAGASRWDALLQVASHSVADERGGEGLLVDGETSRLELVYARGLSERWEIGVEVPIVTHQSGSLDSLIDGWHDVFGLPDGSRDDRPRDALQFLYLSNNGILANFTRSTAGLGDVRLRAGFALGTTGNYRSALRFGLKLPTGDADDLLGSGGTDLNVGLAGDWQALGQSERLSAFYRLHVSWLGEPEYLAARHRDVVVQAGGGLRYQVSDRIGLSAQASWRSALYEAEVQMLGEAAGSLTFGGDLALSDRWSLLIGVGEDILVETTPDVTFQLAVRYQPDRQR